MAAASSRADQARAGLLPSAALAAGVDTTRTEISCPEMSMTLPNQQQVSVSASQPLYRRPANRIAWNKTSAALTLPRHSWMPPRKNPLVRVSQAYFDVLAAQDTLTFVRAQKNRRCRAMAAAQRNFEAGHDHRDDQREALQALRPGAGT